MPSKKTRLSAQNTARSALPPSPEQMGASSATAVWCPRSFGISILGGFGIMRAYFGLGLFLVYLGFALLIWEVCLAPLLLRRPSWVQLSGMGVVIALLSWFSIQIAGARAPMRVDSYAMRNSNYLDGVDIFGIQ